MRIIKNILSLFKRKKKKKGGSIYPLR